MSPCCLLKGEYLTPLDYCSEENTELTRLLKSFGGVSASEQAATARKERSEVIREIEATVEEQRDDGKNNGTICMYLHYTISASTQPVMCI